MVYLSEYKMFVSVYICVCVINVRRGVFLYVNVHYDYYNATHIILVNKKY